MILVRTSTLPDHRIALTPSVFDDKFRLLAKDIPGLRWVPRQKAYVGYADSASLLADRCLEKRVAKYWGGTAPTVSLSVPNPHPLRNYQKTGVEFLVAHANEGVLLADALGIGKSIQILWTIKTLGVDCAVIVCPSLLKSVWTGTKRRMGEVEKWLGIKPTVLHGTKPFGFKKEGVIVIHYEIVHAWLDELKGLPFFALDEIHFCSSDKSRRGKVCKELVHSSTYRIGASATPITNRPKDLWNVVDTLSPGRFGKFFSYAIRYCDAQKVAITVRGGAEKEVWKLDGKSNIEELNKRLSYFMIRRTKEEVALELPPKTRQMLDVEVPREALLECSWQLDKKQLQLALNMSARGKVTQCAEHCHERIGEGNSVVVFTHQKAVAREIVNALAEKGHSAYLATGDQSKGRREEAAFQASQNQPSVLVATIDSMGVGIDLSYANVCIFCELTYIPSQLLQAEGRLDRFGQKRNVLIQYMIGIGTLDEHIRDVVLDKLATFEEAIGGLGDSIRKDLAPVKMNEEDVLNELREAIRRGDV